MTKKEKILIRLAIICFLSAYLLLLMIYLTDSMETVETLQKKYILIRFALAMVGIAGALSVFYVWLRMLAHWKDRKFTSKGSRNVWLTLLICFNILGALIYYFTLIEFNKTDGLTAGS